MSTSFTLFLSATVTLSVAAGDTLYAWAYLDPTNPPTELMLKWHDGSNWEHRAYWGANTITLGTNNTNSRRPMGSLPPTGQWVKLEVPAALVGLEGVAVKGMAFAAVDGRLTWDKAGKRNGTNSTFTYDANGQRVKGVVDGVTTVYIGGVYEYQAGATTQYYEGNALRRTGYETNNNVFYLLQDHLKSSSVLLNPNGTVNGDRNYYLPFGGKRGATSFNGLTTKRFTGQYHEASLPGGEGLSYYGARWYDAKLGRFLSADTVVPGPGNPQAFNRYAYVLNRPTLMIDPTGHMGCIGVSQCIRDPDNPYYAGNANGGTSPSVYPAIKTCGVYDFQCIGAAANSFYQNHPNYNARLDPYLNTDSRYDFALSQLADFYLSRGDRTRALDAYSMRPIGDYRATQEALDTTYATSAAGLGLVLGGNAALRWLRGASQSSRALGAELAGEAKGHYEILQKAGLQTGSVTTAVAKVNGKLYVSVYGSEEAANVLQAAMGNTGKVVSYGWQAHAEVQLYDWLTVNNIIPEAIGVSNFRGPCPTCTIRL